MRFRYLNEVATRNNKDVTRFLTELVPEKIIGFCWTGHFLLTVSRCDANNLHNYRLDFLNWYKMRAIHTNIGPNASQNIVRRAGSCGSFELNMNSVCSDGNITNYEWIKWPSSRQFKPISLISSRAVLNFVGTWTAGLKCQN